MFKVPLIITVSDKTSKKLEKKSNIILMCCSEVYKAEIICTKSQRNLLKNVNEYLLMMNWLQFHT